MVEQVTTVSSVINFHSPQLLELPPLSLYIHFPWCIKKCPYCDFNSHEIGSDANNLPEKEYLSALLRDLEAALPLIWGRRVSSIFIGGGTPSLLSSSELERLLSQARMLLSLDPSVEVTLEANPGTFESKKFAAFREAGVNRLSIGVQSFNAEHLLRLGRIHNDYEARHAIETSLNYFDNINLDLMYALPAQTLEQARTDIETACATGVPHISAYHLTLEPNTFFYQYPPILPDDELSADMQLLIEQALLNAGFTHYEISAFAKSGHRSHHNLNYWQFGDYLGIGAGAHSKISFRDKIIRQMRYKHPKKYLEVLQGHSTSPVQTEQNLDVADRVFEFMMNALRLVEGFHPEVFQARTGLPINIAQQQLKAAEQMGLIDWDYHQIVATDKGRKFLNDLLQIFLPNK